MRRCSFCNSEQIKKSRTYPNMWFCLDCKEGDYYSKNPILNFHEIKYDVGTGLFNTALNPILNNSNDKVLLPMGSRVMLNQMKSIRPDIIEIKRQDFQNIKTYQRFCQKKNGIFSVFSGLVSEGTHFYKDFSMNKIVLSREFGLSLRQQELIYFKIKSYFDRNLLQRDIDIFKIGL